MANDKEFYIKDDVMKKLFPPMILLTSMAASAGELIIGIDGFNASLTTEYTQDVAGTTDKAADTGESSEFGGGLYGGYVWNVNSGFDIGFEAYYDWINVTTSVSLVTDQLLDEKITGIVGLRALPGFKITNNTKIFIEIGWALVFQELTDNNPPTSTVKANTNGFRWGAGLQTMIYDNVSLRAYYSVIDELSSVSIDNPTFGNFTATPTITEFGVGLAYHFRM